GSVTASASVSGLVPPAAGVADEAGTSDPVMSSKQNQQPMAERPRREGFPASSIAAPAAMALRDPAAIVAWQQACEACFVAEAVSLPFDQEPDGLSFLPSPESSMPPELVAASVALLGGLMRLGCDLPGPQWLAPEKRPCPWVRRKTQRYP